MGRHSNVQLQVLPHGSFAAFLVSFPHYQVARPLNFQQRLMQLWQYLMRLSFKKCNMHHNIQRDCPGYTLSLTFMPTLQ